MFTDLKNGNSACATLMFQRGRENVLGSVDIAIMRRSAVSAFPRPYSKTCDTFRPRRRHTATRRADLGTPAFVNINIHGLPSGRFIPQHMPEARPTGIENGLCHSRLYQLGGAYVADRYQSVLPNDPRGLFVKVVTASVGNFRRDSSSPLLVTGSLGNCQRSLILPVMAKCGYGFTVACDSQFLKAQVNTDSAMASSKIIFDLALEGYIPAATRVLHETTGLELAAHFAAFPKAVSLLEVDRSVTINANGSRDKWNPAQCALSSEAGAESRAAAILIARFGELATYGLNGVGVQAQIGSATRSQLDQIKSGRPTAIAAANAPAFAFTLRSNAEIPHLITGNCEAIKPPFARSNSVFESDYRHARIVEQKRRNSTENGEFAQVSV